MDNPESLKEKVPAILLTALATTYDLYFDAQVAHWNITGENFLTLHELFGSLYETSANAIDDVAERIRQLGEIIPESLPELLQKAKASEIKEGDGYLSKALKKCKTMASVWNSVAVVATAAEDAGTVDMAGKMAATYEKFSWKLSATIGSA